VVTRTSWRIGTSSRTVLRCCISKGGNTDGK
jgi:hypothetical protein